MNRKSHPQLLIKCGHAVRGLFETSYHQSAQMKPLSNPEVNAIPVPSDVALITVERRTDIQQHTLERFMRRLRILFSMVESGSLTDHDLIPEAMAFLVIINQHIGSRYSTGNLPFWVIRLKEEIIQFLEAKIDSANTALSAQINSLKQDFEGRITGLEERITGLEERISEIEKTIIGMKSEIGGVRMEMRLISFCALIVTLVLNQWR